MWPPRRSGFAVHNPITQFNAADPEQVVFNKRAVCGPDAAGWRSGCKGDRRSVLYPRWQIANDGESRFRTDAYGRRAAAGRGLRPRRGFEFPGYCVIRSN